MIQEGKDASPAHAGLDIFAKSISQSEIDSVRYVMRIDRVENCVMVASFPGRGFVGVYVHELRFSYA